MLLKSTVCNEIACCYDGKISKEDKVVIKTLRLEKSWSSRRLIKEFPQKGVVWNVLCSRMVGTLNTFWGENLAIVGLRYIYAAVLRTLVNCSKLVLT